MAYMVYQTVINDVGHTGGGSAKEGGTILYRVVSLNFEWEPKGMEGRGHADNWGRAAWSNGTKTQRP